MKTTDRVPDPYGGCNTICAHDLASGVLVSELLRLDGPHAALALMRARRDATPIIRLRRAG